MSDENAPEDDPVTAAVKQQAKAKVEEKPAEDRGVDNADTPAADDDQGSQEIETPADDDPFTKDDGKPFTRKDHTALSEALKKARKEARDHAAEVTRLTAAAGGKDVTEVVAEADQRAEEKWKPLMVRAAARGAFAEAGLTLPEGAADEVFARAVRLLDVEGLTISDTGVVEGLAEQIEGIRQDFPGLFTTATHKPRAPRVQAADKPAATPPKSHAEHLAARLIGAA